MKKESKRDVSRKIMFWSTKRLLLCWDHKKVEIKYLAKSFKHIYFPSSSFISF